MRAAFYAYLVGIAGLTDIVGGQISWAWRKQGSPVPALTLIKTDGADDPTMDGPSGFVDGHVQADCYGATQLDAANVAKQLRLACAGVNLASTAGKLQGAFVLHEQDEFMGENPDRIFRTRMALRIPYSET